LTAKLQYNFEKTVKVKKNLSFSVLFIAKPRHTLRAGAFFCCEVEFFWGGARAGRMTALAVKYFVVV